MLIPFNTMKAIQAAAVLLKQADNRCMSRLRLLKLLYIADRQSIAETLRPITGDNVKAMDHGPVLDTIYDLITRKSEDTPLWERYITQNGLRDHQLVIDPGTGSLSEYEIIKLNAVSAERAGMKDYDIADETHKFPEWIKNQPPEGSWKPIPFQDVLDALKMNAFGKKLEREMEEDAAWVEALAFVRQA